VHRRQDSDRRSDRWPLWRRDPMDSRPHRPRHHATAPALHSVRRDRRCAPGKETHPPLRRRAPSLRRSAAGTAAADAADLPEGSRRSVCVTVTPPWSSFGPVLAGAGLPGRLSPSSSSRPRQPAASSSGAACGTRTGRSDRPGASSASPAGRQVTDGRRAASLATPNNGLLRDRPSSEHPSLERAGGRPGSGNTRSFQQPPIDRRFESPPDTDGRLRTSSKASRPGPHRSTSTASASDPQSATFPGDKLGREQCFGDLQSACQRWSDKEDRPWPSFADRFRNSSTCRCRANGQ